MPVPAEWNLSGKAAIVTGNGRGWASVLAGALAEAGADVAIASPHQSDTDQAVRAVKAHGKKATGITADLTSSSDVGALVDRAVSELGKVDILVNNAQVEFGKPFAQVTEAEWQQVMDVNVKSVFLCCQAAGRQMLKQGGGRIVNISSGLAVRGLWNSVAYCASQGAVHQLTQALALEWSRENIRVNGIGAGWYTLEQVSPEEASRDPLARYLPLRRRGHPADMAGLLVYLASDACDFVTGQTIFIDGGALAHP